MPVGLVRPFCLGFLMSQPITVKDVVALLAPMVGKHVAHQCIVIERAICVTVMIETILPVDAWIDRGSPGEYVLRPSTASHILRKRCRRLPRVPRALHLEVIRSAFRESVRASNRSRRRPRRAD